MLRQEARDRGTLESTAFAGNSLAAAQSSPSSEMGENGEGALLQRLWDCGRTLENYFGKSLDIEWAVDPAGQLQVLQSRPLLLYQEDQPAQKVTLDFPGHEVLIADGTCVSGGAAMVKVLLLKTGHDLDDAKRRLEEDVILVTKTASPQHARVIAKVKGIVTDVGSITSHLASVAREFGVPALFDTGQATSTLADGEEITLWASQSRVYRGVVKDLLQSMRQVKRPGLWTKAELTEFDSLIVE